MGPREWNPTADEVRRIVDEMRPIIQDFARRAQLNLPQPQAH
jgi:hypothetical protein